MNIFKKMCGLDGQRTQRGLGWNRLGKFLANLLRMFRTSVQRRPPVIRRLAIELEEDRKLLAASMGVDVVQYGDFEPPGPIVNNRDAEVFIAGHPSEVNENLIAIPLPAFRTYQATTAPTGVSEWYVTQGSVDLTDSTHNSIDAHSGTNFLDTAGTPGLGIVSQNLATVPGDYYYFEFYVTSNQANDVADGRDLDASADRRFDFEWNNTEILTNALAPTMGTYDRYSFLLQATSDVTTISFEAKPSPNVFAVGGGYDGQALFGAIVDTVSGIHVQAVDDVTQLDEDYGFSSFRLNVLANDSGVDEVVAAEVVEHSPNIPDELRGVVIQDGFPSGQVFWDVPGPDPLPFGFLSDGEVAYEVVEYTTETNSPTTNNASPVTETAQWRIEILGTNDEPVADDDDGIVREDLQENVSGNLLTNDQDIDHLDVLTVANVNGSESGVIDGMYGTLTWDSDGSYDYELDSSDADVSALNTGESLVETFTYEATDGNGGTDSASLNILIQGTTDPVLAPDVVEINEDDANVSGNVLTNDVVGDGLTVHGVGPAPATNPRVTDENVNIAGDFGSLDWSSDGAFTYVLNNSLPAVQELALGETLSDRFIYEVVDVYEALALSSLTVNILGASDASIQGTAYEDSNGNRIFDTGEPVLGGVEVYIDLNDNQTLDADEPTATTANDGSYSIHGVLPGEHDICEIVPASMVISAPESGCHQLNVLPEQTVSGVDFGNYFPASVSVYVYEDLNRNDVEDVGEPPYEGIDLLLTRDGGTPERVETNFAGESLIDGLRPGDYTLEIDPPDPLVIPSPRTLQFTLASGEHAVDKIFGAFNFPRDPIFIDDGDLGYIETGDWGGVSGFGYDGNGEIGDNADARHANSFNGVDTASWTFNRLPPASFEVFVTWLRGSDRSDNVPYTIRDGVGGPVIGSVTVNQKVDPDGPVSGGRPFQSLGTYPISGDTLVVEVSTEGTSQAVIADAAQIIPRIPPRVTVREGTMPVADSGEFTFPPVPQGGVMEREFTVHNGDNETLLLRPIEIENNPIAGDGQPVFQIVNNFTPGQELEQGAEVAFTIRINTTDIGAAFASLSFVHSNLEESPFELELAATVRELDPVKIIMDDGDPNMMLDGDWMFVPGYGYESDARVITANKSGTATWKFTELDPGDYDVSATWLNGSDRASNVTYVVRDGMDGPILLSSDVSQKGAPVGSAFGNRSFQGLGRVTLTGDTLVIEVSNAGTDGAVIADAICIESVTPQPNSPEVSVVQGGITVSDGGTADLGSADQGAPLLTKVFTVENIGTEDLVLQPISVGGAGFLLASPNFTAGQTLAPGTTAGFTIGLSTATVGTFSGVVSFANNDADESPYDLTVTGTIKEPLSPGVHIIDNGDTGFSSDAGWDQVANFGFEDDALAGNGSNGIETAQWLFDGLTPGDTFEVATTWLRAGDRDTAVTYVIRDGLGGAVLASITVDQTDNPSGQTYGTRPFEVLDTVTIGGDSLVVELSTAGTTKAVIADAVRIEKQ